MNKTSRIISEALSKFYGTESYAMGRPGGQVRSQLQALLAEKAALAQENARLLRENTGLQVCDY